MCETPAATDRYYDSKELMLLLHMKETKFYALIKDQDRDDAFPLPVMMGKGYLWIVREVDDWRLRQPRGLKKLPAQARGRLAQQATSGSTPDEVQDDTVPYARQRRGSAVSK